MEGAVQHRLLWLSIVPAFFVGLVFELFLGHRHDYTGHYAAGFGATYCVLMFTLRCLGPETYSRQAKRLLLPICLACIAAGAVAEATAFRIARFDEVDFFNQSLGAVLATTCSAAYVSSSKLGELNYDYGIVVGVSFLGMGGCFAVA